MKRFVHVSQIMIHLIEFAIYSCDVNTVHTDGNKHYGIRFWKNSVLYALKITQETYMPENVRSDPQLM